MSTNSDSEHEQEQDLPVMEEPEIFGGMLNGIMANYFEYEHSDGNTLNLAEVLLLIRQSIDQSTEALKDLTQAVKSMNKTIV